MVDQAPDELDQAASKAMRTTVMAAATAAEHVARQLRSRQERQRADGTQRARMLENRYAAEKQLARTALVGADERWIKTADLQDVASLLQTTATWAELEPGEFGPRYEQLRDQIEDFRASSGVVGKEISSEPGESTVSVSSPDERSAEQADDLVAATVAAGAARDVRVDAQEGAAADVNDVRRDTREGVAYDSQARRGALYHRAIGAGVEDGVVTGRVLAATAQALPVAAVFNSKTDHSGGVVGLAERADRGRVESSRQSSPMAGRVEGADR